tara:strand:+ start:2072 stop:2368 length:297 start_codon:yes stop_codon:yes gene_type:complete
MALAARKSGDIHNKTGSDLASMKTKFDNNKHLDYAGLDEIDVLLYQIQLLREDVDELRRYIASNEMLAASAIGSAIPTSSKGLATGTLWNNRGIISIA